MTIPPPARVRAIAALLVPALLVAACTTDGAGEPSPSARATSRAPSPSASPAYELVVDLRDVGADGVDGAPRRARLRGPARAVRDTMTRLYSTAFVDPDAWRGGTFPGLYPLFAGPARRQARRDLSSLTLGSVARQLDAVEPRRARLGVRFLADARDRPVAAVATMRFEGVGHAGDDERAISHEGEYTLRPVSGSWRIVGYDVRARTIERRTDASFAPGVPARRPMFVLVVGSDARPGAAPTATRADSIHIVGVNPRRGRASVLGIPRDSWVSIPGGGSDKINSALVRGGPELIVETVRRLTGIPIDAYVLTGFLGFRRLVSAVGGIDIRIPAPIRDALAGANFDRGRERLSGPEALAFSRARHGVPNGDFSRSLNQGRVLVAALATLREQLASAGPTSLFRWAVAGARHLRSDLSLSDMFELLLAAPAFDPRRIRNDVASGRVGTVGGLSVVFLDGGAFSRFRDLRRDGLLGS
jgi:LCP family protein required for cell wall assembly